MNRLFETPNLIRQEANLGQKKGRIVNDPPFSLYVVFYTDDPQ